MSEEAASEFEDESAAARNARRKRQLRRSAAELAIALAFIGAVFAAAYFSEGEQGALGMTAICVAGAISILAAWFIFYLKRYADMDEFERLVELRSVALAGGCVVLFTASWGVAEIMLNAPDFPLALVAPLFSVLYVLFRMRMSAGFR